MARKTMFFWIPATLFAVVAGAEAAMHDTHTRSVAACQTRELRADVDGDGTDETIRLVRVGDDAWADVWSGADVRSSTRVGRWREDASLEGVDVNGDGKVDLVRHFGYEKRAEVWLSDGNAFDEGPRGVDSATLCLAQR